MRHHRKEVALRLARGHRFSPRGLRFDALLFDRRARLGHACSHQIERIAELSHLVAALNVHASLVVTRGQVVRRRCELGQRLRDLATERECQQRTESERDDADDAHLAQERERSGVHDRARHGDLDQPRRRGNRRLGAEHLARQHIAISDRPVGRFECGRLLGDLSRSRRAQLVAAIRQVEIDARTHDLPKPALRRGGYGVPGQPESLRQKSGHEAAVHHWLDVPRVDCVAARVEWSRAHRVERATLRFVGDQHRALRVVRVILPRDQSVGETRPRVAGRVPNLDQAAGILGDGEMLQRSTDSRRHVQLARARRSHEAPDGGIAGDATHQRSARRDAHAHHLRELLCEARHAIGSRRGRGALDFEVSGARRGEQHEQDQPGDQ